MSNFNEEKGVSHDFLNTEDGVFLAWAHGLYNRELNQQSVERTERAIDSSFYDGEQFTQEELHSYELRGQKPRVFNEIKPTIDWLLGGERRARTDWAVLPRTEDDSKPSIIKNKLVKYIDDINNARWHRSEAFSDMVKSGEGWIRTSYEINQDGEYQIKVSHEHWRYMLCDSQARKPDMSDMQYLWCSKVLPIETLINYFPDKKTELCNDSGDYEDLNEDILDEGIIGDDSPDFQNRMRSGSFSLLHSTYERTGVRVWEMWYKQNEKVKLLKGEGSFNGEIYDEKNPDHEILIKNFNFRVIEVTREQIYCALYTENTVLYRMKSPYKHNRFPFIRRYAYLKDRTGAPYGVIRNIRDPQSDLNIRRNRALFLLSSARVIMDKGAVDDKYELAHEITRWDAVIEKKPTSELKIEDGAAIANAQINVGEQNSAYIRQVSGVTGENRGIDTNATSGIAIQARQEQGTVITTVLSDMHALARKIEGEIVLSLIEQFMDRKFQFRITADNLKDEVAFSLINSENEPETDITKTQSDFVVAERDYRTTLRQALSEQMISTAGTIAQYTGNPELAVAMLTSAVELQDLPDKDRLIGALRKAAGLPPLNETEEERQAREQQQDKEQQAAREQQQKLLELEQRERIAKAESIEASAEKTKAEAHGIVSSLQIKLLNDKLLALKSGIEAGAIAGENQQVLPIADEMINQLDTLLNLSGISQEKQQIPIQQPDQQPY